MNTSSRPGSTRTKTKGHAALVRVALPNCWYAELPTNLRKQIKTTYPMKTVEVVWALSKPFFREFVIINGIAYLSLPLFMDIQQNDITIGVPAFPGSRKRATRVCLHKSNRGLYLGHQRLPLERKTLPMELRWFGASMLGTMRQIGGSIAVPLGWANCCGACHAVHDFLHIHFLDQMCCGGLC
jgi:hypothetical protein